MSMLVNRMEISKDENRCVVTLTLFFGLSSGLWNIQRMTHQVAAEICGMIDRDIPLANYQGTVRVEPGVTSDGSWMRSQIVMEAMDENDMERALAVIDVMHDTTELLLP